MPQLVVHIRKEGAPRPEPAYAVWVSDTNTAVRAYGPEWEPAAARVEAGLRSLLPTLRAKGALSPAPGRQGAPCC